MDLITLATTADIRDRQPGIAVLPVGSFEQHGRYLPLATDTIVASAIATDLETSYNVLVLPPITMSCSHEHAAWPGTISLSHRTVSAIIDVVASLSAHGIAKLAIISGHGGNYFLSNVVQSANAVTPKSMTLFPSRDDWRKARQDAELETDDHEDMHAGELEVSILQAVTPDALREGFGSADHRSNARPHLLIEGMAAYTSSGVIGRPSAGTAAKGKAILTSLVASFGEHLHQLNAA
jgi:creatinine amidohydrolase